MKIVAVLDIDIDTLRSEANNYEMPLDDLIVNELGWLADSGFEVNYIQEISNEDELKEVKEIQMCIMRKILR